MKPTNSIYSLIIVSFCSGWITYLTHEFFHWLAYISYGIETTFKLNTIELVDLGFLLGFEFKVNQRLSFDLRYNYGLLNFNNADAYEGSETERLYKNQTVNYGMVYKF